MRFEKAAKVWYDGKSLGWSEGSRVKYAAVLRKHLLPAFGNADLRKIGPEDVRDFAEGLSGFASPTRGFALSALSRILKSSLAPDAFAALRFPKSCAFRRGSARVLSTSELSAVISALEWNAGSRMENSAHALLLVALTGMRLGEACALKLSDFDFVRNTIRIHATLERLPRGEQPSAAGTELRLCPTKTASGEREIPIPGRCLPWLRKMSRENPPGAFLVKRDPRTLQNHFKCFLKMAGVADAHVHTLRHTFATHAIAFGADLKTLSSILGHASTHTTLDLYVHPTFESKRRLQESFWRFVSRRGRLGESSRRNFRCCWGTPRRPGGGEFPDWGGGFGRGGPSGESRGSALPRKFSSVYGRNLNKHVKTFNVKRKKHSAGLPQN